tara:strand:- start:968 stop:1480 length:513 start_codon:yes stop_codon:yes gene_type:complete
MIYQERKNVISKWLFELLKNYEVPPHLGKDQVKIEMINMVEDINSECPKCKENVLNLLLEKSAQYIRKNQSSRRWPTIAMFIKAIKEHRENLMAEEKLDKIPLLAEKDDYELNLNAMRIKQNKTVATYWVIGNGAQRLLDKNMVSTEELKAYKTYCEKVLLLNVETMACN